VSDNKLVSFSLGYPVYFARPFVILGLKYFSVMLL
jgi:hypothetical protein